MNFILGVSLLLLSAWTGFIDSYEANEKNVCCFKEENKHFHHYHDSDGGDYESCHYRCCKGWTNYIPGSGCVSVIPCHVILPQNSNKRCKKIRKVEVTKLKYFFKLTSPSRNADTSKVLQMPLLDQTSATTTGYYSLDKFSAHWLNAYGAVPKVLAAKITPLAKKLYASQDFNTSAQYLPIHQMYTQGIMKALKFPFYKFGFNYKPYTKIIANGKWKLDKYFTQQRLAATNPMTIKRVTFNKRIGTSWNDLKKRLNLTFKFSKSVKKITGKGLYSSIRSRLVYVEEYPLFCQIDFSVDAMAKYYRGQGTMRKDTCPIAIYAVHTDRKGRRELKVVAIQIDNLNTSSVYTPKDGINWELAKAQAQIASSTMANIMHHLLRVHYKITPICVGLKRHLSALHPLHEILKFHCRGAVVASAITETYLLNNKTGFLHLVTSIGREGAYTILNKAFKEMKWNDIDIHRDIRKRGLCDRRTLPYFPYRDDGVVISNVLAKFSRDFVNAHYKSNRDVAKDYELQNFINELSADGKRSPDNGKGRMKGLPGRFRSKRQVMDFLKGTIWIAVFHAAINYPTGDYIFTPMSPGKLYMDPRAVSQNNFAYMLPGAFLSILQATTAAQISYLYYDKLFDYSKELQNGKSKKLVFKYYQHLMDVVRPILDKRNARRYKRGQLTYPYLVPGYIPNSPSA